MQQNHIILYTEYCILWKERRLYYVNLYQLISTRIFYIFFNLWWSLRYKPKQRNQYVFEVCSNDFVLPVKMKDAGWKICINSWLYIKHSIAPGWFMFVSTWTPLKTSLLLNCTTFMGYPSIHHCCTLLFNFIEINSFIHTSADRTEGRQYPRRLVLMI